MSSIPKKTFERNIYVYRTSSEWLYFYLKGNNRASAVNSFSFGMPNKDVEECSEREKREILYLWSKKNGTISDIDNFNFLGSI